MPTEQRFWRFVQKGEGDACWNWIGAIDPKNGRGKFTPNGEKMTYAYRAAWRLGKGPIPSGLQVCHSCDNPTCVRLDHLFLGTQMDNIEDMVRKGRHKPASLPGASNPNAKLSENDVCDIRKSAVVSTVLAQHYGVSTQQIRRIRRKDNWVARTA
jgi:hypothetical protein